MTGPVWHDGALDMGRARFTGPTALRIALDSPAAEAIMARAGLDDDDLRDFAARADAVWRLARRRLVKALLGWADGVHPGVVRIIRSPSGAPLVQAPDGWHVSVAGQGATCLVAVARETIGADIEPRTAEPPPLDLLTPAEREWLAALPEATVADATLRLWGAKEAHAKRIGQASRLEPHQVEVIGGKARSGGECSDCWIAPFDDAVGVVALAVGSSSC